MNGEIPNSQMEESQRGEREREREREEETSDQRVKKTDDMQLMDLEYWQSYNSLGDYKKNVWILK